MKAVSSLGVLTCLSAASFAAGLQVHAFGGQVVDGSGDPIVGVSVSLQLDGVPLSTSTAPGGYFHVGDLSMGFFRVEFSLPGYETVHESFRLGAGRNEQFSRVVLHRRDAPPRNGDGDYVVDLGQFPGNFPQEALIEYEKGLEAKASGEVDGAIDHFEAVTRLAPTHLDAHINLGTLYQPQGRLDHAEREYLLARGLTSLNPRPLVNLGGLYILRGQFAAAIDTLREATAMTTRSAEAFYNLGIALYRSRRLREAEVPLLRAVELAPNLTGLRLTLAEVYLRMRAGHHAVEQLEAYLSENSEGKWRATAQRMLAAARTLRDSPPPNPE